jgi:hypothetical protein
MKRSDLTQTARSPDHFNAKMTDHPVTGSLRNISDTKLVTFAVGQQKKSRFQKAREDKEAKKILDELEAAKVYESFVASFTAEEEDVKTFVRGGKILEDGQVLGGSAGETYRLDGGKKAKVSEMEKIMHEIQVYA